MNKGKIQALCSRYSQVFYDRLHIAQIIIFAKKGSRL